MHLFTSLEKLDESTGEFTCWQIQYVPREAHNQVATHTGHLALTINDQILVRFASQEILPAALDVVTYLIGEERRNGNVHIAEAVNKLIRERCPLPSRPLVGFERSLASESNHAFRSTPRGQDQILGRLFGIDLRTASRVGKWEQCCGGSTAETPFRADCEVGNPREALPRQQSKAAALRADVACSRRMARLRRVGIITKSPTVM